MGVRQTLMMPQTLSVIVGVRQTLMMPQTLSVIELVLASNKYSEKVSISARVEPPPAGCYNENFPP